MSNNAIEVRQLSKRYGAVQALTDLTVRFEENCIYGLLGRNGAGKTTLLNLMNNRLFASSGSILIDGQPAEENDAAQAKMFYVGENQLMPEDYRVSEYLEATQIFYPGFDMTYALGMAAEYNLEPGKKLKALSTGYQTIVKLIAALASDARYLLLDEPVLGLDANHREKFYRDLLDNYGKNPRTIIISTHLIEEVSTLIEQVVIIKDGKILLNQSAETVRGMGYSVAGKSEDVDRYCLNKQVLSVDTLGGLKTACIIGEQDEIPPTLQIAALDMQKLFVHLTNV